MKEINTYLLKEIKNMDGRLICIGLNNEKIIKAIDKNNNITECNLLDSTILNKDKTKLFSKTKTISFRKLRKKFKKKRTNNMLINIEHVETIIKHFIKDSIFLTKKTVYIFGKKDIIDLDIINKRYKRYKTDITKEEYKDSFIYKIDVTKAKNSKIKDFCYLIGDTLYNGIELLSDFLVN